jgi:hypothetical protein
LPWAAIELSATKEVHLEYLEVFFFRPINEEPWYTGMMTNQSQQLAYYAIKKNNNQYHA